MGNEFLRWKWIIWKCPNHSTEPIDWTQLKQLCIMTFWTTRPKLGKAVKLLFGRAWASPQTSGTELQDACVCLPVCLLVCLRPNVHLNISRKLNILMHLVGSVSRWRAMQCYCQGSALATWSKDGSSWSMHGNFLLVCHGIYGPTIKSRLPMDCTNYTHWVDITSGKAGLCINSTRNCKRFSLYFQHKA